MDAEERFWEKVDVGGENDCWAWTAAINSRGYGRFYYEGHVRQAHRVAWMLTRGPIPDGQWILHRCSDKACVNPAHLYVGDRSDNVQDSWDQGEREVTDKMRENCSRVGSEWAAYISRATAEQRAREHSRFDEDQIREIRGRVEEGESYAALGREYGVTGAMISSIARRKSYRWVD